MFQDLIYLFLKCISCRLAKQVWSANSIIGKAWIQVCGMLGPVHLDSSKSATLKLCCSDLIVSVWPLQTITSR